MPRQPRLRKKSGYWASDAGTTSYFGKIGEVPLEEAQRRFRDFLSGDRQPPTGPNPAPVSSPPSSPQTAVIAITQPSPTGAELVLRFLAWMERNRDRRNRLERERHLRRWCDSYGGLAATAVEGDHLESFIDDLTADGHEADYMKKHVTTIKMLFNLATKRGWIPQGTPTLHRGGAGAGPDESPGRVRSPDRRGGGPAAEVRRPVPLLVG